MLKTIIVFLLILSGTALLEADSLTEVLVIVKSKDTQKKKPTEKPRSYPKYRTEAGLLKAYANAWSKDDVQLLYHLLSKNTRENWTYSKFKRLLKEDASGNGGAAGFESLKRISGNKYKSEWTLDIIYKNSSARTKTVRVKLVNEGGYWFVSGGGILPPDLSMFDR